MRGPGDDRSCRRVIDTIPALVWRKLPGRLRRFQINDFGNIGGSPRRRDWLGLGNKLIPTNARRFERRRAACAAANRSNNEALLPVGPTAKYRRVLLRACRGATRTEQASVVWDDHPISGSQTANRPAAKRGLIWPKRRGLSSGTGISPGFSRKKFSGPTDVSHPWNSTTARHQSLRSTLLFQRIHPGAAPSVQAPGSRIPMYGADVDIEHRLLMPRARQITVHVVGHTVGG